jgi:hypothetical protein
MIEGKPSPFFTATASGGSNAAQIMTYFALKRKAGYTSSIVSNEAKLVL